MSTACVRKPEWEFAMNVSSYGGSLLVAAALVGSAQAQQGGAPLTTGSIPSAAAAAVAPNGCSDPRALGTARVVEIDTTGGPGFGFEHFKQHDFLREGEVVLTLDDGPWPTTTPAVLRALASHCVKATFFAIGKHSLWHSDVLKAVAAQGHNIGTFSTDMDSFDFKTKKSALVIQNVLAKLKKHGKGIMLMHDFQKVTAEAMPELLNQLKAGGYKIVHLKSKAPAQTLADYDALVLKDNKLPTVSDRPTTSVVRTIGE